MTEDRAQAEGNQNEDRNRDGVKRAEIGSIKTNAGAAVEDAVRGDQENKSPETWLEIFFGWCRTRLSAHPFQSLSVLVMTMGGVLILMFFGHLGAMPHLDLGAAGALLAATAVFGLAITISTLVPAISWAWLANVMADGGVVNVLKHRGLWLISYLPSVVGVALLMSGVFPSSSQGCAWLSGIMFVFSLLLVFVVGYFHALNVGAASDDSSSVGGNKEPCKSAGLFVLFSLVALALTVFLLVWLSGSVKGVRMATIEQYFLVGLWVFANWVFSFLLAIFWAKDAGSSGKEGGVELDCQDQKNNKKISNKNSFGLKIVMSAIVLLLLLVVFFITPGNAAFVSISAVKSLGMGKLSVGVTLTESGCESMNAAARGQKVCHFDRPSRVGRVCPVILQSRIGTPYFFELTAFREAGGWPAIPPSALVEIRGEDQKITQPLRYTLIAIPDKEVLSWYQIDGMLDFPRQQSESDAKDNGKQGGGSEKTARSAVAAVATEDHQSASDGRGSSRGVAEAEGDTNQNTQPARAGQNDENAEKKAGPMSWQTEVASYLMLDDSYPKSAALHAKQKEWLMAVCGKLAEAGGTQ